MRPFIVLLSVLTISSVSTAIEHRNEDGSLETVIPDESTASGAGNANPIIGVTKKKSANVSPSEKSASPSDSSISSVTGATSRGALTPKKEAPIVGNAVPQVSERKAALKDEDKTFLTEQQGKDPKAPGASPDRKVTNYTNTTKLELPCYTEVKKPDGTATLIKVSGDGIPQFTNAKRNTGTPKGPSEMLTGSAKNSITAQEALSPGMDVVYDVDGFTIPKGKGGLTRDYYNTTAEDSASREDILNGQKQLAQAGFVRQGGKLCFTSGGGGGKMKGGKEDLTKGNKGKGGQAPAAGT